MKSITKFAALFISFTVPLTVIATPFSIEPYQQHLEAQGTKYAVLKFYGADPDAFFEMNIPADGTLTRISKFISLLLSLLLNT